MDQDNENNNNAPEGPDNTENQSSYNVDNPPIEGPSTTIPNAGGLATGVPSSNTVPNAHRRLPIWFMYLLVVVVIVVVVAGLYSSQGHSKQSANFNSNHNSSLNTSGVATVFKETGLPNGTLWSMTYASDSRSSTNDTMVFSTSAGRYFFSVIPVDTFPYNPGNGSVNCFRGLYPTPMNGYLNASTGRDIAFSNTTFCGT